MAFLIDDILLLPFTGPIAGFKWVMSTIQKMADEELMNDQPWKERLIELQMMIELGEISEEDYSREEAIVFQALRDIRARREAIARQYAVANLILRDVDRAQDAVQESLVSAWKDMRALRDPDAWDAWLHRLTLRACYRLAQKERRHVAAASKGS